MKVASVVGARPQFIKLKPMNEALLANQVEHFVIHTGQHYDARMSQAIFDGLEIPEPDFNLGVGSGFQGEQTARILKEVESCLTKIRVDWVLVYGDTNSTIATALASVKLGLPTAHVEAGLRSFNRSMPEEINRVLTDHACDLLLAPTRLAMDNLREEGLEARTQLVGDVMADLVFQYAGALEKHGVRAIAGTSGDYFVATVHRASNTDDVQILKGLLGALADLDTPVILVAHPRLVAAAANFGIELAKGSIRVVEPLDYVTMLELMFNSRGIITDSGGLQKEAFLLGVPCTTLRYESEWPETFEGGMNILAPNAENLKEVTTRPVVYPTSQPFGDGHAADRIVQLLLTQA